MDFAVKGRRFARNLQPGPAATVLPLHGGLNAFDFLGSWAGRYELVMNVLDFGTDPADPAAAYRVSLNVAGNPVAPPRRVEAATGRFVQVAPAAAGHSLFFRTAWDPAGGETTISKTGMIRMTLWLHPDEAEALRKKAYEEHRTQAEILREGLRKVLGIED